MRSSERESPVTPGLDLVEALSGTVYDRNLRPGGHSHTVTIDYDGIPIAVDIGFIVNNELNYPELTALFAHLDIDPCSPQPSSGAAAA